MDNDAVLFLTLWAAFGAMFGGVITPVIVANKQFNEWLAALIGLLIGMVGSLLLLIPLWILLDRTLKPRDTTLLPWQRDVFVPEDETRPTEAKPAISPLATVKRYLWAAPPAHSHRSTYIGVFVALAVITAVEVTLTYLDLSFSVTLPLVLLSLSKAVLVTMYFMHLRYDNKWYTAIFALSLPFVAMVVLVLAVAA